MNRYWLLVFLLLYLLNYPYGNAQRLYPIAADQEEQLLSAWQVYKQMAASDSWSTFPEDVCLKPGNTDQHILKLRNNLILTGDLQYNPDSAVFFFDATLVQAVKKFQVRHALNPDGIVGHQTIAALNITPDQRARQIELNLTRWQKTFEADNSMVLVNIPDFTLHLLTAQRKTIWQTKVIVGQTRRPFQTSQFKSKISYLVLHPTWNVPKSIIQREIIPVLKTDPNYLERNRMVLYRQTKTGKIVMRPSSMNWNSLDINDITIIQSAGSQNALGQLKFIFANPYNIYLHDTPIKSLFTHPVRTYSHGCVRVQYPEILASYLLSTDWEKRVPITKLLNKNTNNKTIYLPKPVPIILGYFTCWIDTEGQLQFRQDIYGQDTIINLPL